MTLREAVDVVEEMEANAAALMASWGDDEPDPRGLRDKMRKRAAAMRVVLDIARQHLDDTAEIVLPCATCGGKGEVVREWVGGGGAVSPCPTCCKTPVPSPGQE